MAIRIKATTSTSFGEFEAHDIIVGLSALQEQALVDNDQADAVLAQIGFLTAAEVETLRANGAPFGSPQAQTGSGQTLKTGPGALKSFTVMAKGTSPTLQAWDNATNSGTVLIPALNGSTPVGDFPALNIGEGYTWDEPLAFSNGLHVVIGGTGTTIVAFQVR